MAHWRASVKALLDVAERIKKEHRDHKFRRVVVEWRGNSYFTIYTLTPEKGEKGQNIAFVLLSKKYLVKEMCKIFREEHASIVFCSLDRRVDIPPYGRYLLIDAKGNFTLPENSTQAAALRSLPPLIKNAHLDHVKAFVR